jgi:alginate O-acetyltransferase complex protein AlgI
MTFNSAPYLMLLVAAVLVYWILPVRFRRPFVFLVSVVFYGTWGLIFVWLPMLFAVIVYVVGQRIVGNAVAARKWMCLGISCVLALLVFFKYRGFVITNLNDLGMSLGARWESRALAIAFPVGISFYTFEAIAYLVDLRQGRVKQPAFVDLCLFFFFWPNVLSGPIVRARELVPQLGFGKAFEPRFVFEGVDRIVWGLAQKNVVANTLGIWVDRGFSASPAEIPTTIDGWFLAIAFALQIYFDFAGYTNMAIGVARLLGVTLPENFRQPYHAGTPAEFWTRWHMTLSRWIRDYLFFPINAKWLGAPVPLYLSLVGVMGLVGLWHGAAWGFVIWGLLHGAYLVIYRVYEEWESGQSPVRELPLVNGLWRLLTLIGVIVAWVPFRAPTLQKAGTILSSMFYRMGSGRAYGGEFYVFSLVVMLFCVIEPIVMWKLNEIDESSGAGGLSAFRVLVRPILYLSGLVLFLLFDERNTQFIYSQF